MRLARQIGIVKATLTVDFRGEQAMMKTCTSVGNGAGQAVTLLWRLAHNASGGTAG